MERIQEVFDGENFMNCALCKYRSNLLGFESEVGYEQISHHDHVEGCLDNRTANKELNHTHEHFPYPHAKHPLGPVTLPSLNKSQI
jgi:sirohydrochlorin cobaltochelatase